MVKDGKFIGTVMTLAVLQDANLDEIKAYYADGPGFDRVLGSSNGTVLVANFPGEMPPELYEEPFVNTGNEYSKMVSDAQRSIPLTVQFK